MKVPFITTVDNPYNPYTQFDEWYAFDNQKGYNSCQLLDRILFTSPDLGTNLYIKDKERAIDSIIAMHPFGNYTKIYVETT